MGAGLTESRVERRRRLMLTRDLEMMKMFSKSR